MTKLVLPLCCLQSPLSTQPRIALAWSAQGKGTLSSSRDTILFLFLPTQIICFATQHRATNLTSFPTTLCPQVTLLYFQIPPLTILPPKAFCYLFCCPKLFPYCVPAHLFVLVAFSFLALGLHTAALPPLPSCPAPCTRLPSLPVLPHWFQSPSLPVCIDTAAPTKPHSSGPNTCSRGNFAMDWIKPRTWLCKAKLPQVRTCFSGPRSLLTRYCWLSLEHCCECPENPVFQSHSWFQNNTIKKERLLKIYIYIYIKIFWGRQHKILAHSKQAAIKSSSEWGYSLPCSKQTIVSWQ